MGSGCCKALSGYRTGICRKIYVYMQLQASSSSSLMGRLVLASGLFSEWAERAGGLAAGRPYNQPYGGGGGDVGWSGWCAVRCF